MTTTFLVPNFNKSDPDKVNNAIDVTSPNILVKPTLSNRMVPAISSEGFPANRDGTYVFVTLAEKTVGDLAITFGFTSHKTVDSNAQGAFPGSGMNGVCYFIRGGDLYGGSGNPLVQCEHIEECGNKAENWYWGYWFGGSVALQAKEVICILTISTTGSKKYGFRQKKTFQVIVDGNESDVDELQASDFHNGGNLIYPTVSFQAKKQQLEFISFDQVESTSPRIEELMKEFLNAKTNKAKEDEEKSKKKTDIKKAPKKTKEASSTKTTKKDANEKAPTRKKTAKKETTPTKKTGKAIAKK